MSIRRIALAVVLLLLTAALAALGTFLLRFDLNNYRARLESQLSNALSMPVSIGEARLSLHSGLAIDLRGLRIADDTVAFALDIDHLYLNLDLVSLLRRRISLSAVEVYQPRLQAQWQRQPGDPPTTLLPALVPKLSGLTDFLAADQLRIHGGELLIDLPEGPVLLRQLDLILGELSGEGPTSIALSALWQSPPLTSASRLRIEGGLWTAGLQPDWHKWLCDLKLSVEKVDAASLLPLAGMQSGMGRGELSLSARLTGRLSDSLALRVDLQGHELLLQRDTQPEVPVTRAGLAANLQWSETHPRLSLREVFVDELRLAGLVTVVARDDAWELEGELSSSPVELSQLRAWLPVFEKTPLKEIHSGQLQMESLRVEGTIAKDVTLPWQAARETVRGLRLRLSRLEGLPAGLTLRQGSLLLNYTPRLWQLEEAAALVESIPLQASGTLTDLEDAASSLSLEIHGSPSASQLLAMLKDKPESLAMTGSLPLVLRLKGSPTAPEFDLDADFTPLGARHAEFFAKPAGLAARLRLKGRLASDSLDISQGTLQLAGQQLSIGGAVKLGDRLRYQTRLSATALNIAPLAALSPQLEALRLRGQVEGELRLSGQPGEATEHQGHIRISNLAADFGEFVGSLKDARGLLSLHDHRLQLREATVILGESRLHLEADMADLRHLDASLSLSATDIRARDLLLPSREGRVRDIRARLHIDPRAVTLQHVQVSLAQGTQARLDGQIRLDGAPRVALQVHADFADIDEVIGLFDEGRAAEESDHEQGHRLDVRVEGKVAAGRFSGLGFTSGETVVTYRNRVVQVYPLRAMVAGGSYDGRVEFIPRPDNRSLLSVSGQARDCDSEELYRSQTQLRGLVSGRLSGDFHLQGEGLGEDFWASSRGGFSLTIEDGVLYRFGALAKVFSLLNVSQILTLKAPDMAHQGMPFNHLRTTARLEQGKLATDDLFIDSHAMNLSLVGEVNLVDNTVDAVMGVKPLRTVDKIITRIPIAGWVLAGEEKALITAHFRIRGNRDEPEVYPVPITSVSEKVLGVFRRLLELPFKVITDLSDLPTTEPGSTGQR